MYNLHINGIIEIIKKRKEGAKMKKFNRMSEMAMSKTNGGIIPVLVTIGLAAGAITAGGVVQATK